MTAIDVLRPAATGYGAKFGGFVFGHLAPIFGFLRLFWPVPHAGSTWMLTRYDDVRAGFLDDRAFMVPYKEKLDVIMGGVPFFLGMSDTTEYWRDVNAMRAIVRPADIRDRLIPAMNKRAEDVVAAGNGEIEVVDTLIRQLTFDVLNEYFGVAAPPGVDLRVWATRLFEFQFADQSNDPVLRKEVDQYAPRLQNLIDQLIADRRTSGVDIDDVLGRALAAQAGSADAEAAGYSDKQIRSALIGFVAGGLPQPPMIAPQALEQLLRRPDALAGAQDAARRNDDVALAGYVFEALRFDPLAPAMPRVTTQDVTVAYGTSRAVTIPRGATVYLSFLSAMRDPRRVADPETFNPRRPPSDYIHFGMGLHQCFGIHINMALVPLMLKPLLRRAGLRRKPGPDGHLVKRGPFADRLVVNYTP